MGIANKIIPHYTYEDWLQWEGKWELIEGHPIAMSPTPVPKHQRIAAALKYEIINVLLMILLIIKSQKTPFWFLMP